MKQGAAQFCYCAADQLCYLDQRIVMLAWTLGWSPVHSVLIFNSVICLIGLRSWCWTCWQPQDNTINNTIDLNIVIHPWMPRYRPITIIGIRPGRLERKFPALNDVVVYKPSSLILFPPQSLNDVAVYSWDSYTTLVHYDYIIKPPANKPGVILLAGNIVMRRGRTSPY